MSFAEESMKSAAIIIAAILVAWTVISTATTPPKHITIALNSKLASDPYTINDRAVTSDKLSELLDRLAMLDTNQLIIIKVFPTSSIEIWLEMNDRVISRGLSNIRSVYQDSNIVAEIQVRNMTNGTLEQLLWPDMENGL